MLPRLTSSFQADTNMASLAKHAILRLLIISAMLTMVLSFQTSGGSTCDRRGVIIRDTKGKIHSPGWPDVYPGNHLCIWRLYPEQGQALYFTFKFFQLGFSTQACHHDNLTLIDAAHHVARTFCGSGNQELLKQPLYIPSAGVDILFRADGNNNGEHGFVMEYQAVACKALEIPQGAEVQVEGSSVMLSCPDGTTRSLQCVSSLWVPIINGPLCPGEKKLPLLELCLIGLVTVLLIILIIVCAFWLTKRWTRRKERPPPVYQAVHLSDLDTQNMYNVDKEYAKPCECSCDATADDGNYAALSEKDTKKIVLVGNDYATCTPSSQRKVAPDDTYCTVTPKEHRKIVLVEDPYGRVTPKEKQKIILAEDPYGKMTQKDKKKTILVDDPYGRMTPKDKKKTILVEDPYGIMTPKDKKKSIMDGSYAKVTPKEKKGVIIMDDTYGQSVPKEKKRTTFADGYDVYGNVTTPNDRRKVVQDNVYAQVTPKSLRHKRSDMYCIPVKTPTIEDIKAKRCNTMPCGKTDEEKSREKLSEDIDIHIQLVPKDKHRSWSESTAYNT